MASSSSSFITVLLLFATSLLFVNSFLSQSVEAQGTTPPLVNGLSWNFHKTNCPKLEEIVRNQLKKVFKSDIAQAAGLLRLHFHDCFVQGCEASVLLDGSATGPGEKSAIPNLSLSPKVFTVINDLRGRVQKACGRIVSCSDITALAARDAVFLSGGPDYKVPLGRRDGTTFATPDEALNNLLPPFANATFLLDAMAARNFDATDLVALSGAHTIGVGHCGSFTDRLFPKQDPTMDQTLAKNLKVTCPTSNSTNEAPLDLRSPRKFDNKYYVDLMNRQGLFTSDQDLFNDKRTKPIVTSFAVNESLFFEKFVFAVIKMGQMNVLTGSQGEVRGNCSVRNSPARSYLSSTVVDEQGGETATF